MKRIIEFLRHTFKFWLELAIVIPMMVAFMLEVLEDLMEEKERRKRDA